MASGAEVEPVADQCGGGEDALAELGLVEDLGLLAAGFHNAQLAGK
jgi:hypothetical protein